MLKGTIHLAPAVRINSGILRTTFLLLISSLLPSSRGTPEVWYLFLIEMSIDLTLVMLTPYNKKQLQTCIKLKNW